MTSSGIAAVKRWLGWLGASEAPDVLPAWVRATADRGQLAWLRCLAEPQLDVEDEKLRCRAFEDAFREALRRRRAP